MSASVPIIPAKAAQLDEGQEPQRTAPLSVVVGGLSAVRSAIFPAVAAAFGSGIGGYGLIIGLGLGLFIVAAGGVMSYLRWRKLTYTIGDADIRVESGILSRAARSVPYERIQDVSLEQPLLPRLFGLASVKFETGAGGADDLALAYLKLEDGEALRELVRERRDAPNAQSLGSAKTVPDEHEEETETLFTMGQGRLFTFGLFEFSLAAFAVVFGLLQYADSFVDFDFWDPEFWIDWFKINDGGVTDQLAQASFGVQALSAIAGLAGVFVIGSATGLFRTFSREWGYLLERTPRGFRRRRGLFTKTDVVMPIHRVQGVTIGTRWLRYRFGWHSLKFVSLAQDAGSASHVVAPFAKLDEIEPIVETAGFHMPSEDAEWHRATKAYRTDDIISDALFFLVAAIIAGICTYIYAPEWMGLAISIPLAIAALSAVVTAIGWRFKRHTLDDTQIMVVSGVLAPKSQYARRVKLHSAEVSQGPIARWRGYATLHLGLAGGELSIPGIPVERARKVRRDVLATIAQTDFSQLEHS
ncbi:MAG: PH domain-containing protein [Pseudomonadota bacterium]